MKKFILILLFFPLYISAQTMIDRVEPPFWWVGMNEPELQIMVYGKDLAGLRPETDYRGMMHSRTVSVPNQNYLFLYFKLNSDVVPGEPTIRFRNDKNEIVTSIKYRLEQREKDSSTRKGYDNSDVMYLITPDRFANGNPNNDNIDGMPDKLNRNDKWGRHGGDISGILKHLDYLSDIGFTAIWLNPVLENNQAKASYHGYSTTDFYKVDARFGTNEEYKDLSKKAGEKGLKMIMDMILNHCGSEHLWMKDLPSQDWVNNPDNFFRTSHRRTTLRDPYKSNFDLERFSDGWFVPTMPDMNQRNPLLGDYLIQNTIWWIEYADLGGIRVDTYSYSDNSFMSDWTCAVMNEYPNFNICGEEWSLNPSVLAYWQKGKINSDGYISCLPGLLDFPLQNALVEALNEKERWNAGMINLYQMLSNDFQYSDPARHVIFPDNHDMSRIFTQLNEDFDLFKMAIVYFATMRGTPQFYYGTEILMSNMGDNSHGNIRSDYPGGWENDEINAFTNIGLTNAQKEARRFFKKLLNWRKTASVIHQGKLMHFAPVDGVYTFFRYDEKQKVMVVFNKGDTHQKLDLSPFAEILKTNTKAKEIISGSEMILQSHLNINPKQALILEITE